MVTEKEYNAYMNREKALVKKRKAEERKALAKAKAKAKAEERKALAKAKAKAKKSKAKSKVKPVVPFTGIEMGSTNPDALMATPRTKTPKAKAKAKVKTSTAKKRVVRPKSQGVMTERYYIVADVNGTGRNMRYFNVASGRAVENQRNATYGITPEEANSRGRGRDCSQESRPAGGRVWRFALCAGQRMPTLRHRPRGGIGAHQQEVYQALQRYGAGGCRPRQDIGRPLAR